MARPPLAQRLTLLAIACAIILAPAVSAAQISNPCSVITKAEAEATVGGPLIGPELSPKHTLCKYYEDGYGDSPSKIRLVTIGIWNDAPDAEAINTRRLSVARDSSILPLVLKELNGPGDGAIWVWAGNRFGALYAFRGGTTEVAVKISGVKQDVALAAAKRFATRALGTASKSNFTYEVAELPMTFANYYAPRIMSSLYLGTFGEIADDPLTRGYILTLGQEFNNICPSVPNPLALLEYGYYNEFNGQKDMFKSAAAGNVTRFFHDFGNIFKRARPHMVEIAASDANMFIIGDQLAGMDDDFNVDRDNCMNPQVEHLYKNIAAFAQQRRHMPPDVEDDASFMAQLRVDAQKANGFDPRAPRTITAGQAMKKGCTKQTASAAAMGQATDMEIYCRCLVDAAVVASVPDASMRELGVSFDDRSLRSVSDRYPAFAAEKKACYH